jgi:hypothetical protein
MFDPKAHLIHLPRRVKDPITGHFTTRSDEYLEVKWRLVWFREKYPHGSIITEEMVVDLDQGYARFKTTVGDGEGGIATGTGTETRKGFEDFVEKAETRSIGRALAALGIGTQFVGEELSEGEHIADAPVQGDRFVALPPLPAGEDIAEGPAALPHPTAEQIDRLFEVAAACREPKELLGRRLREVMGWSGETRITKKRLRESMTTTQYTVAFSYYEQLLKRQIEEDVPDESTPTHGDASASQVVPEASLEESPTEEGSPAVSSAFSSAPANVHAEVDADQARDKLRREALTWQIQPVEIAHILAHHDLAKTRTILWKARRNTPTAVWVAAAD